MPTCGFVVPEGLLGSKVKGNVIIVVPLLVFTSTLLTPSVSACSSL